MNLIGPELAADDFGDPSRFVVPDGDRTLAADWVITHIENAIGRTVECEAHGPVECFDWWYVPEYSIGTRGFIVDKHDRNIRVLSSRPDISLASQFAAYAAGFRHDLMDLIVTRIKDSDATFKFFDRRNFWRNPKEEVGPGECPSNGVPLGTPYPTAYIERWRGTELADTLRDLPCRFRSQRLDESTFLLHADELPFDFEVERGT